MKVKQSSHVVLVGEEKFIVSSLTDTERRVIPRRDFISTPSRISELEDPSRIRLNKQSTTLHSTIVEPNRLGVVPVDRFIGRELRRTLTRLRWRGRRFRRRSRLVDSEEVESLTVILYALADG